jgi:predicted methyltransferase
MLDRLPREGASRVSLDLGLTETTVVLRNGRVVLSDEAAVSLDDLRTVAACDDAVFALRDGAFEKLLRYSEETHRTYKLRPTPDWPALEIGGILMHRIAGTTPRRDAEAKLRAAAPVRGAVLDTCMGLGYSAILAARSADSVTVIEKDENVWEMARVNPFSRALFVDAAITRISGDAAEVVAGFGDAAFDFVDHDPPTLSVAGELYSNAFYAQVRRILKPGGRFLHYTGAPGRRGARMDLAASVTRRLDRAGFVKIRTDRETACVLARAPR